MCTRPEGGKHTIVQGSVTKGTAKYPRDLCRAVLRGLTAQLRADRRLIAGCYGIQVEGSSPAAEPEDEVAEKQLFGPAQGYSGKYKTTWQGNHSAMTLLRLHVQKNSNSLAAKACG